MARETLFLPLSCWWLTRGGPTECNQDPVWVERGLLPSFISTVCFQELSADDDDKKENEWLGKLPKDLVRSKATLVSHLLKLEGSVGHSLLLLNFPFTDIF